MSATSSWVEFDRARIEALLSLLDARLRHRGVSASVYLVGGAAVALTTEDRRVTQDVDGWASDMVVIEEAQALATEEGLPPMWLNERARSWIPPRIFQPPFMAPAEGAHGLTVHLAPAHHLLAMKMVALRGRDLPDIVALARLLGLSQAPANRFAEILHEAYTGEDQLQHMLGVPHDEVEAEAAHIGSLVVNALQNSASGPA